MKDYDCEICGKKHEILRGLEFPLPERIREIPEEERETRIKEIEKFYVIDNEIFLTNGQIFIYLKEEEEPFYGWSVWASISLKDFQSKRRELESGNNVEFEGKLESAIPFYEKTQALKVKIIININYEYPIIKVEEPSQLKVEQTEGITKERAIAMMQMFYHNQNAKEFRKPFVERLEENIDQVEKDFLEKDKNFIVDISFESVLFQLVNNKILEVNKHKEGGFGLHLAFDDSNDSLKEELANFRKQDYFNEFSFYVLDEIPIYQIDLGRDKNKIIEMVKRLVIDVYEEDLELIGVESYEM